MRNKTRNKILTFLFVFLFVAAAAVADDYYQERTVDATADTISFGFEAVRLHVCNSDADDDSWVRWDGSAATQNTADPTTDSHSIKVPKGNSCINKTFYGVAKPTSVSVICASASCAKIMIWAES